MGVKSTFSKLRGSGGGLGVCINHCNTVSGMILKVIFDIIIFSNSIQFFYTGKTIFLFAEMCIAKFFYPIHGSITRTALSLINMVIPF